MFIVLALILLLTVILILLIKEKETFSPSEIPGNYQPDGDYDFQKEDSHVRFEGVDPSGSVYSANMKDNPGLTWVL